MNGILLLFVFFSYGRSMEEFGTAELRKYHHNSLSLGKLDIIYALATQKCLKTFFFLSHLDGTVHFWLCYHGENYI